MLKLINTCFSINKVLLFFFYAMLYIIIFLFTEIYVITSEVIYNTLGEQIAAERFQEILNMRMHYKWISYGILPLLLLLRYLLVSVCLMIGSFFAEDYELSFKRVFGVVLTADIIFIVANAVKVLWVYFNNYQTLEAVNNFSPLSILNFFSYEKLEPVFIYPLQMFNLFEIGYVFLLAFGLLK